MPPLGARKPKGSYHQGKANEITVNRHLEKEPSGCVIWMMLDKDTLELGPFLWFGAPRVSAYLSSTAKSAGTRKAIR